ncbi:MAG: tRNA dihydrouridine synthase DusB [Acutalibacteraceae bacterium]
MQIGTLKLKPYSAALAPMAGVADRAFREICVDFGASYVVSEMVSSKGLTMCDRKSKQLLVLSEKERPAAAQIFGSDPLVMAESAKACLNYNPEVIDINMGCPAPKIAGNGGGSALMKNPDLAEKIMRSVKEAVDIPVTVKIRLGWDKDSLNCIEIAQRAEKAGMSAVTLHGRTRQQMYAPPVDLKMIAEVKRNIGIPLIGNGDIVDGISAAKMLEETGCDYLMVGRGALGRPWVFGQINAYLEHGVILPEPPVSQRMLTMLKHVELIIKYKGERVGIREARKHAAWYIKGIKGVAAYRQKVGALESMEQLQELAYTILKEND